MDETTTDALAALQSVRTGREALAARAVTPGWYHPTLGVLVGLMLASVAAHSLLWSGAALVVFYAGIAVAVSAYRRVTGVWMAGPQGPATRRVIAAYLVVLTAVVVVAGLVDLAGWRWAWVVAGVGVGVAYALIGSRWDEAYRRDLQARA